MPLPSVTTVAVVGLVLGAAVCDLRTRRLPNALTLGSAAVALAIQATVGGWPGFVWAVLGWAAGIALFAPLFALRGMGAGDVKLLAAIGAWTGPGGALWTALYGAIAGGVMALAVVLTRGSAGRAFRNVGRMLSAWAAEGIRPVDGITLGDGQSDRLPYALPLAVGAIAALWMH